MKSYKYFRGSEWRRWDLHAHTPLDCEWISAPPLNTDADKKAFAKQYVEAANKAQISVIAITDHNFCGNSDELLIPYIQEAAKPFGITIFPGFEITIADCGGTHILCIFPEDSSLKTIDAIMSQLFPPGNPRFREKEVMPSKKDIEELNKILAESGLQYLLVFAHADRENGVLGHRGSELRVRLWNKPFVRIAQLSKAPSECVGFISDVIKGTNAVYSRNITYIQASDCRCLDQENATDGRHALGSVFTWIKADPSFEGLRQIIFEPKERTCFQVHRPIEKPEFTTIDSVRFINGRETFQSEPIKLNPDLTTIIGGKSTGKSILLSCIAHTANHLQAQEAVDLAKTNEYDLGEVDFEVTWSNGDVNKLSDGISHHPITFLPQMYIHRLVEKENHRSLSDSLLAFLRQKESFETRYSELIKEKDHILTQLATEVSSFFTHLSNWNDIVSKMNELGDKESIDSELDKIVKKADALQLASGFSEDETKEYQKLQKQLEVANQRHKSAQRIENSMKQLVNDIPVAVNDALNKIDEIITDTSASLELQESEVEIIKAYFVKLKISIHNAETDFVEDHSKTVEGLSLNTINASNESASLTLSLTPFWDKISNQKELREFQARTKELNLVLEEIKSKEKEKSQIERKYWASIHTMEELVKMRYELQVNLIGLFNDHQYSQVGDDTVITANIIFSKDKFEEDFLSCFDLRYSIAWLSDSLEANHIIWTKEKHAEIITGMLHKLINKPRSERNLRSGQELYDALNNLLQDYLSYDFSVKQAGEDLFQMSPGKQGLILLEIFLNLSNSNYPILIDQPEDNLDNRTIYSHLVNYLKDRKKHRQIIIVTHNANLVLGADSECWRSRSVTAFNLTLMSEYIA